MFNRKLDNLNKILKGGMNMDRNYHNSNFPPNTDPHLYAVLAVTVGFACVGDYNANEQNSIGNWLILVGQYILTHADQQQLIEARLENNNLNTNSQKHNTIKYSFFKITITNFIFISKYLLRNIDRVPSK